LWGRDVRHRPAGPAQVARERVNQTVEQQLVQHRVGLGEQSLERAREPRELRHATRGEQLHDVSPHRVEQLGIAAFRARAVPRSIPRRTQLGAGA
jgi:hypothetical protein